MATTNTRLTGDGTICSRGASVFTVYIEGGAAADDVIFLDGGSGGSEVFRRGTDAANQKRQYTLRGIQFSQDVYADLGANIAAVEVEHKPTT